MPVQASPPATPPAASTPLPTQTPWPSPTSLPTWPVVIPTTATPTVQPARLTAADLLPRGAQLLADAVADVGPDGVPAAVLVYQWPVGPALYYQDFEETDLHMKVWPLHGTAYMPQGVVPSRPIRLLVADLNGDGWRDVVVLPRWEGPLRFAHSGLAAWPRILSAAEIRFQGGYLASPINDRLYFRALRPTLYYAGPKQATFADVGAYPAPLPIPSPGAYPGPRPTPEAMTTPLPTATITRTPTPSAMPIPTIPAALPDLDALHWQVVKQNGGTLKVLAGLATGVLDAAPSPAGRWWAVSLLDPADDTYLGYRAALYVLDSEDEGHWMAGRSDDPFRHWHAWLSERGERMKKPGYANLLPLSPWCWESGC